MIRVCLALVFFLANGTASFAAPLPPQDVPEPLRPWVKWALHDYKEKDCPFLYSGVGQAACVWPAHLELTLDARGGTFSQQWLVFAE